MNKLKQGAAVAESSKLMAAVAAAAAAASASTGGKVTNYKVNQYMVRLNPRFLNTVEGSEFIRHHVNSETPEMGGQDGW